MAENKKRLPRLKGTTIIAIIFVGLFIVSLAAVFITPKQTTQTTQTGYVNVSREEHYWMSQSNNTVVSRYLVNYGFDALQDTPNVTVTDKTDPNLTWIPIVQSSSNVRVNYNNATGVITVVATNMKAGDKVFAQAAFEMDPVNIFASGQSPSTQVSPPILNYGDEKDVTITLSPFAIQKTSNITEVGVYAWFTEAAANITSISTTPHVDVEAPQYQAISAVQISYDIQLRFPYRCVSCKSHIVHGFRRRNPKDLGRGTLRLPP